MQTQHTHTHVYIYIHTHVHIQIHIYAYVCVCICVFSQQIMLTEYIIFPPTYHVTEGKTRKNA